LTTAVTLIGLLVPLITGVLRSVAVSVWLPAVLRVTVKMPVPATNDLLVGMKLAPPSLLLMPTEPV
jgi:hypothetical protein